MDFEKLYNDVINSELDDEDMEIINKLNEREYSSTGEAVTVAYMVGKMMSD